jgi:hypothetical protein
MGLAVLCLRLFWREDARAAKHDHRRFNASIREHEINFVELKR